MTDTTAEALRATCDSIDMATKWIRIGTDAAIADGLKLLTDTTAIMRESIAALEAKGAEK